MYQASVTKYFMEREEREGTKLIRERKVVHILSKSRYDPAGTVKSQYLSLKNRMDGYLI